MSSSKPRTSYVQDYIARIRYSNALPPPPCAPKLLEIPNTGLSSGQYTSAGFASRLAREQPLNIEADAELGMPIDLVGIPGVFDGDETAIQAMDKPPVLHAADRALMRAPNALGKQTSGASGISFLRRTEYTTAHHMGGMKFESSNSSNTMRLKTKRRRPADLSKDDPRNISKHILKGFNIAYPADAYNGPDTEDKIRAAEATSEEKQAWRAPKHPTNHSVHVVDSYPLLPDWDALPDTGAYMLYKFVMPPVRTKEYDDRLDVALLRPAGRSVDDEDLYFREKEERMHDPSLPDPIPRYHFEFFLPADNAKVRGIKRNLSTYDPDNEEDISFDAGVDEEGRPKKYFKYENIRTYETSNQVGNLTEPYSDVVAVSLHDPESHPDDPLRTSKLQKAAYFYPIAQRTNIRPKQTAGVVMVDGEQPKVDIIEAVGRDPDAEIEKREAIHKRYDVVEA